MRSYASHIFILFPAGNRNVSKHKCMTVKEFKKTSMVKAESPDVTSEELQKRSV